LVGWYFVNESRRLATAAEGGHYYSYYHYNYKYYENDYDNYYDGDGGDGDDH